MSRGLVRCSFLIGALAAAAAAAGCGDDPRYLQPPLALEVNATGMGDSEAMGSVTLPIRLETEDERADREALADELGVGVDQLPFVTLDDLDVSIEWTITNLQDVEGIATIGVNGANEMFAFDPTLFDLDPEDEEVQPPPPLAGGIPMVIGPNAVVTGVVREDQLREASIDLELMARGGLTPLAALLGIHEEMTSMVDAASGVEIPVDALAGMIRFDVVFTSDRHMTLEVVVRVRDRRGLLHDDLMSADPAELTPFAPAALMPPAETM